MENSNESSSLNMQILTPSGFQPFDGIARYWHEKSLKFVFHDKSSIETAYDHIFIVNEKEIFAKSVKIGDNIGKVVKEIIQVNTGDYFYDPINVSNGKIYQHDNGLVSHNTFFGTGDTLVDAETLMSLRAYQPVRILENGNLLVYKETVKDHEYIMTVDVSKGRGQDYSTFTIIDVSVRPFEQVVVYRNNRISPILYPNVIFKYATVYNDAYVVIESNDQGSVVCNGLYHDLEYENVHVESAVKSNAIGIEITRRTKRLGCSAFKDLLETGKLKVVDENTIMEISTFESKGQSYEASDGNHDDIVMNLVMFGYFVSTQFFADMTNINLKEMLFNQKMKEIEDDVVPFGFIDDGSTQIADIEREDHPWAIEYDPNL